MSAAHVISQLAIVVGAIGCGRVEFDRLTDAAAGPLGAFSTPEMLLSTAGFDDDDPELTTDGLELYFTSARPGGLGTSDIWRATRANPTDEWGTPSVVVELSSSGDETQPSLCCGDLVMYFGSARSTTLGSNDIFRAERASTASPWQTPVHVVELSTTVYDGGGPTANGELEIFFDSERGGAARQIYRATRATAQEPWSTPVLVPELASTALKVDTSLVTPLQLVFSAAPGDLELYSAERAAVGEPFGTPVLIEGVNTDVPERDPWMSPDGRTIYFARQSLAGDYDIFTATR